MLPAVFCLTRKKNIDEELAEIEPLVREAKEAVGNIKSDALSEIRYGRILCCIVHCFMSVAENRE